jgi:hypothetical protein
VFRISMAANRQKNANLSEIGPVGKATKTNRITTDTLAGNVLDDKRLQGITNTSVEVALLRLTTDLETTNRALVSLTATVANTGETSTRAVMNANRWVAMVDKRVNFIKTEIYTEPNVPPLQLDANLLLLFVLQPNPIVETYGLYSILMGDSGASNIALTHYALSLWVIDELIEKGIDTDWLPPVVSDSMPGTDIHTIQMNIQMHSSAKTQAEDIDWSAKLSGPAASIGVYLSHTLMDLYSLTDSSVSTQ